MIQENISGSSYSAARARRLFGIAVNGLPAPGCALIPSA
jgi:hypothetical protein